MREMRERGREGGREREMRERGGERERERERETERDRDVTCPLGQLTPRILLVLQKFY